MRNAKYFYVLEKIRFLGYLIYAAKFEMLRLQEDVRRKPCVNS